MKFSKEQIEDTIINGNIIDTKTKQEIIISEYEKSQKNIQPIWLGEGLRINRLLQFYYKIFDLTHRMKNKDET